MDRTPKGLPPTPPPPGGLRACPRRTQAEFARKMGEFLTKHGDLPPSEVPKSVADQRQWTTWCDGKGEIAAGFRIEQSDWYLCTLKNAAVRPDQRGKRIGSKLYKATTRRALRASSCLVLAADVTSTNTPSIRALERAGFRKVNRFCWSREDPPADILHYVKLSSDGDRCG